jgi:hypothetical protein
MHESRIVKLQEFVEWCGKHITGDEKGEAQLFLDRLFQAFGQKGSRDVGGSPEMRIRKAKEDGGGTAFADYVWKPVVLIEMKSRRARNCVPSLRACASGENGTRNSVPYGTAAAPPWRKGV